MPTPIIAIDHIYKVFSGSVYLGLIPNVRSEFETTQDINTGSAQLDIVIASPIERSKETVDPILTEAGTELTDEFGATLLIERQPDLMGIAGSDALIVTGNTIYVYKVSDYEPAGELVFTGDITTWEAEYNTGNSIKVTTISRGNELKDYVMQSSGAFITEINQSTSNSEVLVNNTYTTGPHGIFQIFTPVTDITIVKLSIQLRCDPSVTSSKIQIGLGIGNNPQTADYSTLLDVFPSAADPYIITDTSLTFIDFAFLRPVTFSAGQPYVIGFNPVKLFDDPSAQSIDVGIDTAGTYTGGTAWTTTRDPVTFDYSFTQQTYDVAFKLFSTNNSIRAAFTSSDPADIFRAAIDVYRANGGQIDYTVDSVDDTGLSIDYTFNLNTVLEAVEKARELSPGGWYWYVDPSSLTAYFKEILTTPTHIFLKGNHISSLVINASIEDIRNVVYFTGGDDGSGSNLFTRYTNPDSITILGRQRLERLSDSRVTLEATADQIATNFLDNHEEEYFQAEILILDTAYNTRSINLGDTTAILGYGNFIDQLVLQVVSKKIKTQGVMLTLGILPFRQVTQVTEIEKSLDQLRVVDNPTSPS